MVLSKVCLLYRSGQVYSHSFPLFEMTVGLEPGRSGYDKSCLVCKISTLFYKVTLTCSSQSSNYRDTTELDLTSKDKVWLIVTGAKAALIT